MRDHRGQILFATHKHFLLKLRLCPSVVSAKVGDYHPLFQSLLKIQDI